jgi:hypothetical protein
VVLLFFLGLAALALICVAFSGYGSRREREEDSEEPEEYPEGIQVGKGPIPSLMVFVYVAFIIWAVGYVLVIGILKGPF